MWLKDITLNYLTCKRVLFLSEGDELAFFEWISKIRSIQKWEGKGDEIHLYPSSSAISEKGLRELIALFYRYEIDMHQLQQFVNDKNREWFTDKKSYWHKRVFGDIELNKGHDSVNRN